MGIEISSCIWAWMYPYNSIHFCFIILNLLLEANARNCYDFLMVYPLKFIILSGLNDHDSILFLKYAFSSLNINSNICI